MPKRTEDETQKGLIALALFNGSAADASRALEEEGVDFTADQLTRLKNTRPREYWEHRQARLKIVRSRMGEAAGRLADKRSEMIERVLDRIDACIDEADLRDLTMILGKLDSGYATSIKAMGDLTGAPTARVEVNHTGEIIGRLERIGVLEPSTVDAEVVEESDQPSIGSSSSSPS